MSWARRQPQTTLRPAELLKASEVAAALRVSGRTVQAWCAEGLFPGAFKTLGDGKGGGHWRIPRAALDKLLADQNRDDNNR